MNIIEELKKYDYKDVFRYFAEISEIPRGSGNMERISAFLYDFGRRLGYETYTDSAKNVIIRRPASAGYEAHEPVVLQGHMDMVCVSEPDCKHDFENDGLELFIEDGWLGARGTTLGGDDGIAVAYCMALLADKELKAPELEIIITTDEETGMDGAIALDMSLIKGRRMINIDSEDEGVVLCSCAGGMRVDGRLRYERSSTEGRTVHLELCGLKGGHSGAEIDKNRSNAVVAMARLLSAMLLENPELEKNFGIIDICGGEKDNAIPSSATADIIISGNMAEEAAAILRERAALISQELSGSEPGIRFNIGSPSAECVKDAVCGEECRRLLFLLLEAPNGVQVMSSDIEGLVESSLNLGIFRMGIDEAHYHYSLRSSKKSYKYYMRDKLVMLFDMVGSGAECGNEYPAWEYKRESALRDVFTKVYREEYNKEPLFMAIHAGLECGLVSEKAPDMDMISIGPNMRDIHSERERLDILSSIKVYKFLEKLLAKM